MMKKILVIGLAMLAFCGACHFEHNYTRKDCEVIAASAEGATFEDRCGWTWFVEGEGYKVGQTADLKMHDGFTSADIDDDIIKEVIVK